MKECNDDARSRRRGIRLRVGELKPKVIEPELSIRILSVALLEEARPDLMVSHNLVLVRYMYASV